MDVNQIYEWKDMRNKYTDCIVLGNGSSIAVSELFKYESLYKKAQKEGIINPNLNNLFKIFDTNDFETILHKLLQADAVNHALAINNKQIEDVYANCREALIKVIQKIHPNYDDIEVKCLKNIAEFLKQFKTVVTLNYDLLLYWAMYQGNLPVFDSSDNVVEEGSLFKDCFIQKSNGDNCFESDWKFLKEPIRTRKSATLIFYLHGNLSLASHIKNKIYELDVKIASPEACHLEVIFDKWKTGNYSPIFICEGESKRKLDLIKNNSYLSTVYYNILDQQLGDSVAFYGFNFGNQDEHIISRFSEISRKQPIKNMAISVFQDGTEKDYMARVEKIINDKFDGHITVEFYNSQSKGCWNNDV